MSRKTTSTRRARSPYRVIVALLTIAATALAVAACGGSSTNNTSNAGAPTESAEGNSEPAANATSQSTGASSTLTLNNSTALASLDPSFTYADFEAGLDGAMYSELTQVEHVPGPSSGIEEQNLGIAAVKPYLAESWQWSDGKRTLTFHLRKGLKFPSGDPLNAEAVVWSLKRTITGESGGYSVLEETDFKPPLVQSISAPNESTVVIHYKRPAPNQLQTLSTPTAGAIYDPKLVEAHGGQQKGKPNKWLASHDAGYGPYLLKSYQANHQMVLEANPNFFEQPKTKKIIINFISDNETLLLDAQSGAADVTLGLSDQAAHSLAENACCNVVATKSRQAETLNWPETSKYPEFKNQDFRQALSYAFPYQGVLQKVAYGYGKLYFGEWMPAFSWYEPSVGAPREYNVSKAKQLLAASGIKTPVSFPIYVSQGDTVSKEIATAASGAWQQLGVNAKVEVVSPGAFLEVVYSSFEGPTVFLDGPQVVAPDYYWAYDLQGPPNNQFNDTRVYIPKADKLMKELPYVTSASKRQELLNEVDKLYIEATPRIWVYNQDYVSVLNKDVTTYYASDLPEIRFWGKG